MKLMKPVALALTLLCVACSGSGSGGGGLSEAECKQFYVHTYALGGTDAAALMGEDMLTEAAKGCAEANALSREDFTCTMAAKSMEEFAACNVTMDLSGS